MEAIEILFIVISAIIGVIQMILKSSQESDEFTRSQERPDRRRRSDSRRALYKHERELLLRKVRDATDMTGTTLRHDDRRRWTTLRGQLHGSRRVEIRAEPTDASQECSLTVSVPLTNAKKIDLRVRQTRRVQRAGELGSVDDYEVAGGDGFDDRHVVEAGGYLSLEPLEAKKVRKAVSRLLGFCNMQEVAIQDGELRLIGRVPYLVGKKKLRRFFSAVSTLASAYDRQLGIKIGLSKKQLVSVNAKNEANCPYCHDTVSGGDDLVCCDKCKTVIHEECHSEHGRCPILGCGHERAKPARQRA